MKGLVNYHSDEAVNHDFHQSNYIHPTCIIYPGVTMGENNYFGPFCVIGGPAEHKEKWDPQNVGRVYIGSNNKLTGHVTIDSSCSCSGVTIIRNDTMMMKHSHVGHDATICNSVTLSVGAIVGGHVWLCEGVNVGCNGFIHQRQVIAPYCMIGAGTVVTKHLHTEPFMIYVGIPAKVISENERKLLEFTEPQIVEICSNFKNQKDKYEQTAAK